MKRPSPVCLLPLLPPSIPIVCLLGPALASPLVFWVLFFVFLGCFFGFFFGLDNKKKKKGKKIINGTKL